MPIPSLQTAVMTLAAMAVLAVKAQAAMAVLAVMALKAVKFSVTSPSRACGSFAATLASSIEAVCLGVSRAPAALPGLRLQVRHQFPHEAGHPFRPRTRGVVPAHDFQAPPSCLPQRFLTRRTRRISWTVPSTISFDVNQIRAGPI